MGRRYSLAGDQRRPFSLRLSQRVSGRRTAKPLLNIEILLEAAPLEHRIRRLAIRSLRSGFMPLR